MKNRVRNTILGCATLAIGLTGCTSVALQPDQVGVHQFGYTVFPEERKLGDCLNPSQSKMVWTGDSVPVYPAGQRTYTFSAAEGSDAPPVKVVKDNIELSVEGSVTFFLNGNCDTLKAFHANIGNKDWSGHNATVNDGNFNGWKNMLDQYIGTPLNRGISDAIQADKETGYLAIYNGDNRATLEDAIEKALPGAVKGLSGGDYFVNFQVQLKKPDIDQSLKDTLKQREEAVNQNAAQESRNAAVTTEITSIKELVAVLGQDGYIAYQQNKLTQQQIELLKQAVEKGQIQVLPVPTGSGVSLPIPPNK